VPRLRLSRLLPHYRHLLAHGTEAQAVVLRSESTKLTMSSVGYAYRLTLEVHYADGTTGQIVRTVTPPEVRYQYSVGDVLPVRYNPDNHDDADIDLPAVQREQQARGEQLDARLIQTARASLTPPAPVNDDAERLTGLWFDQLMRLKLGHTDGTVSDEHHTAGFAAARAALHDGSAVLVTGADADYVRALAAAILGDPIPGPAESATEVARAAALLESVVRLKMRHESGELNDEQLHAAMAEAGRAAQEFG
jgi:hypothetical protein